MDIEEMRKQLAPPRGDKPRKIVVCHPDIYPEVQKAVVGLGHNDVLVQPNRYVSDPSVAYVMDSAVLDLKVPTE